MAEKVKKKVKKKKSYSEMSREERVTGESLPEETLDKNSKEYKSKGVK